MASMFPVLRTTAGSSKSWHRRMSNNLAAALVTFAGLQIFVISAVVATGATTLLYHIGIAILIAAVIPAARNIERRWETLSQSDLSHHGLAVRFRMDQLKLWTGALLLPLGWIPVGAALRMVG
jgi:hypothetical protein